jgi:mRNA-degrading endonuclease RelE of RelBE toxin-antitoxin system
MVLQVPYERDNRRPADLDHGNLREILMSFAVSMADSFLDDLRHVPRKVEKAVRKTVLPRLRSNPHKPTSDTIKKLKGWKSFWRYRIGDYRLIYDLDHQERKVTLLLLGARKDVYNRLGHLSNEGPTVGVRLDWPEIVEVPPSDQEYAERFEEELESDDPKPEPTEKADSDLPYPISEETLTLAGVPDEYWSLLLGIAKERELLAKSGAVPDDYIVRILNVYFPPTIDDVLNQPRRVLEDATHLEQFLDGERTLESFLLDLDEEQQPFVDRFHIVEPLPTGPWIVKGGPGTGKSTLALYALKTLAEAQASDLLGQDLRILFTTYTRSLVRLSEHLLGCLGDPATMPRIDVRNVDSLAWQYLPDEWRDREPQGEREIGGTIEEILRTGNGTGASALSPSESEYLAEEIEGVIFGNNLRDLDSYLDAARPGRGRGLGRNQKEQIWRIYQTLLKRFEDEGKTTFTERLCVAEQQARPKYDYVFIDEVQDLRPVAIRFCVNLCHDPTRVFLTADANQSIYGSGMKWSDIAEEFDFRGRRSKILKRNYRTTVEIFDAVAALGRSLPDADQDTLDEEAVYHGDLPILSYYRDSDEERSQLNSFLRKSLIKEKVAPSCAAVLCSTNWECEEIEAVIDGDLNPKAMSTKDIDFGHNGVKVMTMAAAKGLEFPIVAVARVEEGRCPWPARGSKDPKEHVARQRRMFFVACSRAMRQLMVMTSSDAPSPFIEAIEDALWDVRD